MLAILILLSTFVTTIFSDCSITWKKANPPLVVDGKKFAYPTSENGKGNHKLDISDGSELTLYCHYGENLREKDVESELECKSGKFSQTGNKLTTCSGKQEPWITRKQEKCSPIGADGRRKGLTKELWLVQIGWKVDNDFIEQIEVCHDEATYGTIWTHHIVHGASIQFRDKDPKRPPFRVDTTKMTRFYTWTSSSKLNKLYSKKSQVATIKKLLGQNKVNGKPVIENSSGGTNYFAKGHLSPDAGFVYNVEQDATYYFMNVAPQFQSFNNGNWKALEGSVRELAQKLARDIEVYTGTFGILEYPNSKGESTPIYLYNEGNNKYVPAPQYYWKVLHDTKANKAVAFIGLNDPHATEPPKELCKNVCSEMSWVDWKIEELSAGYMYCCTVKTARKAIKSMPDIKTTKLVQME